MDDRTIPIEAILTAREGLVDRVHRTPMLSSATAAAAIARSSGVRIAGHALAVKAESFQKTGSFKVRATRTKVASLTDDQRAAGIITLSAGNAAQAYAWAGRDVGVHVTVVMPNAAVRSKVDACRGYGAEVVLHGDHVGETWARVQKLSAERGLVICHPFDDPHVIAGNGSVGLEILEDLPDADVVVVPVGGGGLISGIASAIKQRKPGVRIYGVEPEESDAVSQALARDEIVTISPRSVADGLGAPFAGSWTLPLVRRYVDAIVRIDDPTILGGLRFAAERMKLVLEPAGAAAIAASIYGKVPLRDGDRVCVVASGGNVETSRIGELLAMAAPLPDVT